MDDNILDDFYETVSYQENEEDFEEISELDDEEDENED